MKENINLYDISKMLLKWWWIAAVAAVLFGAATYTYSEYFMDRIYVSKGSFYISSRENESPEITINQQNANARFSETYIELIQSESVLEEVGKTLENSGYERPTVAKLRKVLAFSTKNETEVMEVSASSSDPYLAQAAANAVLSVAPAEIKKIVKAGGAAVVDMAKLPLAPSSPNVTMNTVMGFLIGLVLGCVLIFLIEFFDLRIKPDNNLEEMYGIPVIGNIPEIKN